MLGSYHGNYIPQEPGFIIYQGVLVDIQLAKLLRTGDVRSRYHTYDPRRFFRFFRMYAKKLCMGILGIDALAVQHIRQDQVITKFRPASHLGLGVNAMKRTANRRADGIQIQSKNLPLKKHVEWKNGKCTDQ